MSRTTRTLFAIALVAVTMQPTVALAASEVNVYSARKEDLIKPLLDRFTAQTGVKVNLVTGKEDALLTRLQSEGAASPADLLVTTDAGRLHRAKDAGVTQAITSPALEAAIPASYRDPQGHWFGLSLRARPILYVKGKVDPATLSTYEALADPQWKGKVCVRGSDSIYNQSLVASLIAADGAAATETWAEGLVANLAKPPQGGDRDQIKAAAAGQCDLAIANTYYLAGMLTSADAAEQAAAAADGGLLAEPGRTRRPCERQRGGGDQGRQAQGGGGPAPGVHGEPRVPGLVCAGQRRIPGRPRGPGRRHPGRLGDLQGGHPEPGPPRGTQRRGDQAHGPGGLEVTRVHRV